MNLATTDRLLSNPGPRDISVSSVVSYLEHIDMQNNAAYLEVFFKSRQVYLSGAL